MTVRLIAKCPVSDPVGLQFDRETLQRAMVLCPPWICARVLLALFAVGPAGLVKLAFCLGLLLAGSVSVLWLISRSKSRLSWCDRREDSQRARWPGPAPRKHRVRVSQPRDSRLTGVALLDSELNEMVTYLFRDFLSQWHAQLSHSGAFPLEVHNSLREVLSAIAEKIQSAEWIPFLTTRSSPG